MQSFVSQPVWARGLAYTKLRTPAEPESGPGNAAVKFHGTLSKKRITWCSPGLPSACPPPACLAKHYPNYPMLPVPKLCIKYNLVFWNEPKTKSINIQKFFVSLHSWCFLWCSKVRTILHGSLCWHAFIIFVVLYKCIPADDIIMMILCISPLSSQYCPSLTHVSLYWISHFHTT